MSALGRTFLEKVHIVPSHHKISLRIWHVNIRSLQRKRNAIESAIAAYEKKIEAAKCDLAHVNATLRLFESPDERNEFPVYVDTLRLFRRGEIVSLCKAAIAAEGLLDTRELALRVIRAKGWTKPDTVLRTSIAYRIVQAMRLQAKRGIVTPEVKRKGSWYGACKVWGLHSQYPAQAARHRK
jgi:hypothetical protein